MCMNGGNLRPSLVPLSFDRPSKISSDIMFRILQSLKNDDIDSRSPRTLSVSSLIKIKWKHQKSADKSKVEFF